MAAGKKSKGIATEFDNIIQGDRQRRKNAQLAEEIFGKGRKSNGTTARKSGSGAGLSLSDRISNPNDKRTPSKTLNPMTFKQTNRQPPRRNAMPATSNIDGEWTHDLHGTRSETTRKGVKTATRARVPASTLRNNGSLDNGASLLRDQVNIIKKLHPSSGMTIRGLAGPYTIIAENFAIGTTAEDIQSAMAPIGGPILKCTVNGDNPVTSEITFESKEGADNVIAQFHGQIADGNALSLYHKIAVASSHPTTQTSRTLPASTPIGPRSDNAGHPREIVDLDHYAPPQNRDRARQINKEGIRGNIVDGSYGFDDQMDMDHEPSRSRPMYSDRLSDRRGDSYIPRNNDRRDNRSRGRDFR